MRAPGPEGGRATGTRHARRPTQVDESESAALSCTPVGSRLLIMTHHPPVAWPADPPRWRPARRRHARRRLAWHAEPASRRPHVSWRRPRASRQPRASRRPAPDRQQRPPQPPWRHNNRPAPRRHGGGRRRGQRLASGSHPARRLGRWAPPRRLRCDCRRGRERSTCRGAGVARALEPQGRTQRGPPDAPRPSPLDRLGGAPRVRTRDSTPELVLGCGVAQSQVGDRLLQGARPVSCACKGVSRRAMPALLRCTGRRFDARELHRSRAGLEAFREASACDVQVDVRSCSRSFPGAN